MKSHTTTTEREEVAFSLGGSWMEWGRGSFWAATLLGTGCAVTMVWVPFLPAPRALSVRHQQAEAGDVALARCCATGGLCAVAGGRRATLFQLVRLHQGRAVGWVVATYTLTKQSSFTRMAADNYGGRPHNNSINRTRPAAWRQPGGVGKSYGPQPD